MNIWSLLYFSSFLFYTFTGIYVLTLSRKSIINIMFFFMCLTLSLWSLGYAFSTGARDVAEALSWRGVSTMGWTFFYSTLLLFFIAIANSNWAKKNLKYCLLLYVPSIVFFLRFWHYDTGNYEHSPYGWIYVLYYKSIWSTAFDIYYLVTVLACFALLLFWRKHSDSLREQKQVQLILSTMIGAFICGALTDTILPLFGIRILPMSIIFSSIVVVGIWIAITKYKMMNLTQEIAADHVLIAMMDPVIVMNNEYVIGQVNNAALDLTGFKPGEIIGEEANCIIHGLNKDSHLVRELTAHGFMNGYEIELTSKSGKCTPCLCSGVCVETDYGERIGVILVLHDITARKRNEELIKKTNEQLKLKIAKINNVFDNVGEGILTFNKDLKVQDEYSLECEKLFGEKIENKSFSHLLYPDNVNMEQFMSSLLTRIFTSNKDLRALYFPLLPDEALINQKVVSIHYKLTTDEASEPIIMAILSDITEKIQLESTMDQERKTLKMVIKTLLNREDFIDLLTEYQGFAETDFTTLKNDSEMLLRRIHTLKGNFSQFYMLHLIDSLDNLEEQLHKDMMFDVSTLDPDVLKSWLSKDMEIIESYVGKGYFKEGQRFTIENEQLLEIENRIQAILDPQDAKSIMPYIKNLRNKSFHELLGNYPDYTVKLGERWHKNIAPFDITGDIIYVDAKAYQNVVKSLVHIFRNCVAHGIETEDERLENGKVLYGKIHCDIKDAEDRIQIIISDDGRGIDVQAIEKKVLEEGLANPDELSHLSPEEKLQMIFGHRVSTIETATTLSGRGVGLSAVKAAVDQCGGNLKVSSLLTKGTQFSISLPKGNAYA